MRSSLCQNIFHFRVFPLYVLRWQHKLQIGIHWDHRTKHWPQDTIQLKQGSVRSFIFIITRISEVIMFSPCVFVTLFVCLFVCLCLYHDVCPDDLTMKDWCHTNNILQVHCWGCLVVQVMFHALMTSSMTSPGHKVGQILKVIYLRQYLS